MRLPLDEPFTLTQIERGGECRPREGHRREGTESSTACCNQHFSWPRSRMASLATYHRFSAAAPAAVISSLAELPQVIERLE